MTNPRQPAGKPEADNPTATAPQPAQARPVAADAGVDAGLPREVGGPSGPEPTRYGDWERKGRCIDF